MTKLDDLIEATLAPRQGCWASQLEGDAAKYVAALVEAERAGNKVSRVKMQKFLADIFEVRISEGRVRNHLARTCSCR